MDLNLPGKPVYIIIAVLLVCAGALYWLSRMFSGLNKPDEPARPPAKK